MREYHLIEQSYGSNDRFNDGKIKFLSTQRAYSLVTKISDDLYVLVLVYLDGRVVFSTVTNPDVFRIVNASIKQILNPMNMAKAFTYRDEVTEMLGTIISKFYNRIDVLNFVTSDRASLTKMERYLKTPEVSNLLRTKRYKYVEHTTTNGLTLINYSK